MGAFNSLAGISSTNLGALLTFKYLYRAKKTPAKIGNVFVYFLLTLIISTYKYLDMIL